MPTAHRVACLRDDAVFLVFLYQRWCYPVDKKRANEYGIAYEREAYAQPAEEAAADAAAAADATRSTKTTEALDVLKVLRLGCHKCSGRIC